MLQPDNRHFGERVDAYGACRKCGCNLIILPDDRRQGFCFDCFDPLTVDESTVFTNRSIHVSCD